MKICSKCKVGKDESEFRIKKTALCGLRSQCRSCDRIYKHSERGRLADLRYSRSVKGRLTSKKRQERYCQSTEGRLKKRQHCRDDRERKRQLDIQFSEKDAQIVYERFSHKCFNCSSIDRLAIDHHYPLSLGHGLTLQNAVLLCKSCNSSKGYKLPEEFYSEQQLRDLENIFHLTVKIDSV